jgi:hypothetical protein
MERDVYIKVVDQKGQPLPHERVSIFATNIEHSGGIPDQTTDGKGQATFHLNVDEKAEVIVYVRGKECVGRGPLLPKYELRV